MEHMIVLPLSQALAHLQYGKRQEAGQRPGNEAKIYLHVWLH